MTDYSPFTGRHRQPDAPLVLIRTLWTMRTENRTPITAAIFEVLTGRELRLTRGDDLIESRLLRTGDTDLEQRAAEVRTILEGKGWKSGN